ncbi:MAG: cation:proton antiporter [Sandaracinaceae bacterium]|jgi:Kef-type K+ transport system membrane component KefB|nr:cation:proton antiporter [Sandaracinaceae bacterium]MBK8406526.1 cation:proton antiporter [Sandaracinaceae bacterium]MBK8590059.1 cation:proton antiporter [Sandaracinaceae bacterium]MBP7681087.1 cation:proton antiporter [Deltaproteobacteria bacterium]
MHFDSLTRLLLQVGVIIGVSQVFSRLGRRIRQPSVVSEILAGVALGPSLLGVVWPEASAFLFPPTSLDGLEAVAQLGLILFMFLVGLELDPGVMKGRSRSAIAISQAGIVVPFALGLVLASQVHARLSPVDTPFLSFALFLGVAMSITAFPVLARLIDERGLLGSPLGTTALAAAAIDDVTAWCLLAFVVSFVRAEGILSVAITVSLAVVFVVVMATVGRRLLPKLAVPDVAPSRERFTVVLVLVVASASFTHVIGIHALFGAFCLGVALPHDGRFAKGLEERIEDLVVVAMLPIFFAHSGLRTNLGLLDSMEDIVLCVIVVLVAVLGKLGGVTLAARFAGHPWREATTLGVLMNTRGLMELVVLHVGLDLGVLSPKLFTMMVIMALVTTMATGPAVSWLMARRQPELLDSTA